jgi:hypothetical protein
MDPVVFIYGLFNDVFIFSFLWGWKDECVHGTVGVQHAKGNVEEDERYQKGVS